MPVDKINDLGLHNRRLRNDLATALQRVLDSGWYILGPEVTAFESEFAAYCGVSNCVSVANGTDALEMALRGVLVDHGAEVITAANAGMYSSTAILAVGAKPVYADVDEQTMILSPGEVEGSITASTGAIVVTHLYGQMADMPAFRAIADKHAIPLIEDCAQAHGAILHDKRAGSWGDAAAFSFYPTKNLGALGDGGAVMSDDSAIADRIRSMRQYGWEKKYQVRRSGGRNSRLDEIQAAVLRIKLRSLDKWNSQRREVAKAFNSGITNRAIRLPLIKGEDYVGHLYVIRCRYRDELCDRLKKHGVATEIHYPTLDYNQPILKDRFPDTKMPVSERLSEEILTLPCYPELTLSEVNVICEVVNGCTS